MPLALLIIMNLARSQFRVSGLSHLFRGGLIGIAVTDTGNCVRRLNIGEVLTKRFSLKDQRTNSSITVTVIDELVRWFFDAEYVGFSLFV